MPQLNLEHFPKWIMAPLALNSSKKISRPNYSKLAKLAIFKILYTFFFKFEQQTILVFSDYMMKIRQNGCLKQSKQLKC